MNWMIGASIVVMLAVIHPLLPFILAVGVVGWCWVKR